LASASSSEPLLHHVAGRTVDRNISLGATDGVEDGVYALARDTPNLLHEVLMLVVDWDAT
jgi:hypothetical protein